MMFNGVQGLAHSSHTYTTSAMLPIDALLQSVGIMARLSPTRSESNGDKMLHGLTVEAHIEW